MLLKLATENTFILLLIFTKKLTVAQWVDPFLFYFHIYIYIYITKSESEVINPSKPKFYKRFVDDIINRRNRRNKNQPDNLFQKHNSNHPVDVKPEIFLDTKMVYSNDVITTSHWLPIHWSSKFPKRYKRNTIIINLNRATRINLNSQLFDR